MTITGELTDLLSVLRRLNAFDAPLAAVVASSFGAVSLLSLLAELPPFCERLVLWNPVLDLGDTFLRPSPPWGRRNFGWDRVRDAIRHGGVVEVDGAFRLPAVLFLEMECYDVEESFRRMELPTIAIHGTADSFVSFGVTQRACEASSHAELVAVEGSDHGFQRPEDEARALDATAAFLLRGSA
ncbi:MAG: alpha/beta hydrolase [Actinomycetota bacterium]|nr:alpha/beta hydrolase [Actinomycetota bacterium]